MLSIAMETAFGNGSEDRWRTAPGGGPRPVAADRARRPLTPRHVFTATQASAHLRYVISHTRDILHTIILVTSSIVTSFSFPDVPSCISSPSLRESELEATLFTSTLLVWKKKLRESNMISYFYSSLTVLCFAVRMRTLSIAIYSTKLIDCELLTLVFICMKNNNMNKKFFSFTSLYICIVFASHPSYPMSWRAVALSLYI